MKVRTNKQFYLTENVIGGQFLNQNQWIKSLVSENGKEAKAT